MMDRVECRHIISFKQQTDISDIFPPKLSYAAVLMTLFGLSDKTLRYRKMLICADHVKNKMSTYVKSNNLLFPHEIFVYMILQ